jgi:hypothetical protein
MEKCNRCGKSNTEYSRFTTNVGLSKLTDKVKFRCSSWVRKVVKRYVAVLARGGVDTEIVICQRCQSTMFRGLDKDK